MVKKSGFFCNMAPGLIKVHCGSCARTHTPKDGKRCDAGGKETSAFETLKVKHLPKNVRFTFYCTFLWRDRNKKRLFIMFN